MPKGKILMGKGSPKPKRGPMVDPKRKKLTPEQMRAKQASGKPAGKASIYKGTGKASIYKGTDKTTNKTDYQRRANNSVVYADGSKEKLVTVSKPGERTTKVAASARVYSRKKGNTITTYLDATDPLLYKGYMTDSFPRHERTITTLGKDGRKESVLKRSGQNNSAQYVVSETQLNRGAVRKGTVGKKKAY